MTSSDDFVVTVALIASKKAQVKALTEEIEALFASIPESTQKGDYPAGDFILEVRDNKSFNAAQAKKVLPEVVYESILVPKPDTILAKRKLTGEQYEACQLRTGVTRYVKPVTDNA